MIPPSTEQLRSAIEYFNGETLHAEDVLRTDISHLTRKHLDTLLSLAEYVVEKSVSLEDLLWKHRATNLLNKEARENVVLEILAIVAKMREGISET